MASVRLSARPDIDRGTYRSAIIVTMPSGSHTYWKEPGDAGVPPVFAFNGSINVAKAQVLFPAPVRIVEDGLQAIGYNDRVIFPVVVTPIEADRPTTLHLDMSYAVCNKICMPGHAKGDLALPVKDGADDAAIAAAFAAVPQPLQQTDQLRVTAIANANKPSWTVVWDGKTAINDLFALAPEGYAFDTRRTEPNTWTLIADQTVSGPKTTHVSVALTLAGVTQSFETIRTIDLPASAP